MNETQRVPDDGGGIGFAFYAKGDVLLDTPIRDPGNFFHRCGDEAGKSEFAETGIDEPIERTPFFFEGVGIKMYRHGAPIGQR